MKPNLGMMGVNPVGVDSWIRTVEYINSLIADVQSVFENAHTWLNLPVSLLCTRAGAVVGLASVLEQKRKGARMILFRSDIFQLGTTENDDEIGTLKRKNSE